MKKTTLFVLFAFLLLPSLSSAASYFVAKTGNNSNAGTSVGTAWLTIQKAANTIVAGDTVTVSAGTYAERVSETTSGSAGNLISYVASGTVVTQGFQIVASYVKVTGFEIAAKSTGSTRTNGSGVWVQGSNNQVTNNSIHDLCWEGIVLSGASSVGSSPSAAGTSNNLVQGNHVNRAWTAGVFVEGQTNTIESNEIDHTIQHPTGCQTGRSGPDADGIRFFGSGHIIKINTIHDIIKGGSENVDPHSDCFQTWGPATSITFEQNKCQFTVAANNSTAVANIEDAFGAVSSLTFKNNLFFGLQSGILVDSATSAINGIKVLNNTFANLTNEGVYFLDNAPNGAVQNNLFYNVSPGGASYFCKDVASATGLVAGKNNHYNTAGSVGTPCGTYTGDLLNVNPLIVNAGSFNFHLLSNSPLINVGTTLAAVTNDFDSVSRPRGPAYDIGAFEFTGCP